MEERAAILLLAHGTPDSAEEIPEYLRNVVSGRPMPAEVIEEVRHRFVEIGGSPLTALTLQQGRLLQEALGLPVYVGMRNWKPYIADVVKQMVEDGITRAVAICLAPQNSRTSVGLYRRAVFAEAGQKMQIGFIEGWAEDDLLAAAFADRLRATWEPFRAEVGGPVPVLFTAHSVPCRTVQAPQPDPEAPRRPVLPPDPYNYEAKKTAMHVAAKVDGLDAWYFAFQSQGMSGGPWIGPTVEDTLTALHQEGIRHLVIQPVGFLCDHVEILYDIDIAFRDFAQNLGMMLRRPASLNDSPLLTAALARLAQSGLDRLQASEAPEPAAS
ncbi:MULTISPECIES: ferrochelatase [Acidobacterium]|uniref:Ferrochelatase n=1 Tax=Acidobacterium capsulatum (strain ATCC 51196 / DSM 11244 / BCRC 80197 / JCM 7670 / NBRC 15755 / NCIMB 13165 / 161) TaxID=240015 RepID=HEMH_ACIC5|nr:MULTISPECIES: ferrochelatase [Acidobacterium]C1F1C7.1 RecName: Full=Ferrochelatase; AltName: Full=Heme synthase; AltName: Full=Protoheme ferro-lyase [Acidobacterium capsulatum ATCC 51196]ACO33175.1 ferrochelatase [Acidobacterium capsulatum ATCC 51196]HCT62455.1 ferrochelatase [Acidobacterium sp.]